MYADCKASDSEFVVRINLAHLSLEKRNLSHSR